MDYSLDDLDVTKRCEIPFEFEVINEVTGKGVGIFLTIIGSHAQVIADFTAKELNERRVAEAMQSKRDPRGKNPVVVKIEDDIEFSTELIALRIVAWRGIKEPFSHENAVKLCHKNAPMKEQILAKSDDMKNFPMPFSTSSPATSDTAPT